ncbi:phage tail tape measure protein [Hymenobacter nivis]|uniref:Phage tail tape measure protein domain-containing protein n=1 Tax=Hymenobacter nivis TaxID=1850093 RepID=A0A502HE70_9BACT|nr:phage tail tape measure protein [Hymenobacter nivis]TPG71972.1 hypothetical protein EAH73_01635 [Hymenobacter nivis]
MATDKETRELEIVLNAQKANASIKELGAGFALMKNQLDKMAADDPRRAKLNQEFLELKDRLKGARDQANGLIETEEQLNKKNAEVILNGQKVNASFKNMTDSAEVLQKQLEHMNSDAPGRKKLLDDYHALQERIEGVKKEMGAAEKESSVFKEALAFAGVTVGAEAVLEGIKELGAEIVNTTKEVANLRGNINTLTGATGKDLDGLTTSVLAVSRTFSKDFNEVLQASNTLSKQMGVSQQEAMRLIQQGFLAGADAGGDFLDQVKEYAPQFKDAGFAAQEFIGHISQSATQGIFSDKGADVVKEFGLRIREQTKATTEALQSAFGSDFTKEIFDGINNGTITVEQALQRVGKEMDETKIPANQLQTVIADVFGGPGEDAGIDYLKSLKNVGKGVDELVDKTNVYTQRQERLLNSQTELAEAQNELTKSFEGGGTILDTLTNKSMTVLYTLLASLGATFKELFQPVQEVWGQLTQLAESMGWLSEGTMTAKSAGQLLGDVLHAIFTPTRLLWGVIADITKATVEWAKSSDNARGYLNLVAAPVRALYDLLSNGPAYFQGFSAAAAASFGTLGRVWQLVKDRNFSGASAEFATLGKSAGDAYRLAFTAATDKAVVTAATVQAGGEDPAAKRAAGGDGQADAVRQKAGEAAQKAREKERKDRKAAQDKADQERLDAVKKWVKEEGDAITARNVLRAQLDRDNISDELKRHDQQREKIFEAAGKQADALTGQELDYTERVKAIMAERDLQLRELQARFDQQAEQDRKAEIDKKIALNEADEQESVAKLQVKLAEGILNQQQYDEALFQAKQASRDRELAMVKAKNGEESAEYKKLNAEKLREQAAHTTKTKATEDGMVKFKKGLSAADKLLNDENVQFLADSLGKQTIAYRAFQVARKAAAIANIGVKVVEEVQTYWATAATLGPIAGPIYGTAMSALAIARGIGASAKIAGFAKGGATGDGMQVQGPTAAGSLSMLGAATGLRLGANGKLRDDSGFNVAGIVHENEYVIPAWLREDPQVLQVEDWLETRRLRGFAQGGATSDGGSQAGPPVPAAPGPTAADANQDRLLQVLTSLDGKLQDVQDWATQLQVVNDLLGLDRDLKKVKQVQNKSGIGTKPE